MHNIQLSFNEIKDAIKYDGHKVTMMIEGEPGIGKSALGAALEKELGYHFAYMDIANMSMGDLMYPVPNAATGAVDFYPNAALKLHTQEPVIIMLDEWPKGNREVKNMTLPLMAERRLGSTPLHKSSIVFMSGNQSKDGVGDTIQAHQKSRLVSIKMKKPTEKEWIDNYAIDAQIDPTVIAFANQYPQIFQSYEDDEHNENGYIFNPRKQQLAYVCPRTLRYASDIVKTRANKSDNATQAQLVGAIGAVAAADLMAFVRMNEELPPFASIIADPEYANVPTKPVNRLLLTFSLLMRVDKDNCGKILKYMERMNNEMQALFLNKLLSSKSKQEWAAHVPEVGARVTKLHHVF